MKSHLVLKVEYRDATDADYAVCEKLHHEGMRPYCEPIWGWDSSFQNERYMRLWCPKNIKILCLKGRVIGLLETQVLAGDLKIDNIFVEAALRGQGIGTWVLEKLLRDSKGKFRRITLNVLHNNPANRLYKKLGFSFVRVKDQVHEYEFIFE